MFLSDEKHVNVPTTHRSRHRHLSGAYIYLSEVFQQGWRLMCSQKFCTKYILSTLGPCCLQLFSRTGKVTLEPENGGDGAGVQLELGKSC